MMMIKPKFWDKEIGLISILLLPFSLIVLFLISLKRNFTKNNTFNIPVICVGNIYVGGTGKTPMSIFLSKELVRLGKKTVIIRKFYKEHIDEHNLIKNSFESLILNSKRPAGIREAIKSGYDVAVLDDGFQDYSIKKNLNIVCFNQNQLIGNGLVLPAGPLRESLDSLTNADIIIVNGQRDKNFEERILKINSDLKIFYSRYKAENLNEFKDKRLFALAGIGNPENFFQLIENNNLIIEKKFIFPDHYKFSKSEIQNIISEAERCSCEIIMTEKDYFKIKDFNLKNINYLKVSLVLDEQENLFSMVKEII